MRPISRRGFTLVELLIAIVIFGIVSAALYGLLTRTQRVSRVQAERSAMQANVRTGVALVTSELLELSATATTADIYAASGTAIEYRGMRGLGFICEVNNGYVRIPRATWRGYRDPVAGRDRLLIFVDNDVDLMTDDGWIERTVTSLAGGNCPDGSASIRLNITANIPSDTLAMLVAGSPVRTFERMEIAQTTAGGETWLGARSVSAGETLQPVLGPLAASGVTFTYWTGNAGTSSQTSVLTDIRTVRLVLRGVTENIVAAGGGTVPWQRATDSLLTDIRLRNAP